MSTVQATYGPFRTGMVFLPTGGVRVQVPQLPCKTLWFVPYSANTGPVYLGGSAVTTPSGATNTTDGVELPPGGTPHLFTEDTSDFWLVADNDNERVFYFGYDYQT